eukprot:gene25794-31149_t
MLAFQYTWVVLLFVLLSALGQSTTKLVVSNAATSQTSSIDVSIPEKSCVLSSHRLVTLVILYFEECDALRFQVLQWISIPSSLLSDVSFLVVDDHSSLSAAECLSGILPYRGHEIEINIVRVDERKEWNIGGGRNVASFVACTPYLLIVDMDVFVGVPALSRAMNMVKGGAFPTYSFSSPVAYIWNRILEPNLYKPHPAVMLMPRSLYWKVKGCDEDFVGHYGNTDVHFKYRSKVYHHVKFPLVDNILLCRMSIIRKPSTTDVAVPAMNKSIEHNSEVFTLKKSGQLPWNDTVVRFKWHLEPLPAIEGGHHSHSHKHSEDWKKYKEIGLVTKYWHVEKIENYKEIGLVTKYWHVEKIENVETYMGKVESGC